MENPPKSSQSLTGIEDNQFYQDVVKGLLSIPKRLDSKYFYDSLGDRIFQEIMDAPEYYLTKSEMEIFNEQSKELAHVLIDDKNDFNLIELGAGDATKSKLLLKELVAQNAAFTYYPIDISANVIAHLEEVLPLSFPDLKMSGLNGDYLEMIKQVQSLSTKRNVVLFLGANIGNADIKGAQIFCRELRSYLKAGDLALVGIDLKKDAATILAAYNDQKGITSKFNLNLLKRINSELQADFDLEQFVHKPTYDPSTGECRSFLVSKIDQHVRVGATLISFEANEIIDMEISQKYSLDEIEYLASVTNFKIQTYFFDRKKWFVDAVWKAVEAD